MSKIKLRLLQLDNGATIWVVQEPYPTELPKYDGTDNQEVTVFTSCSETVETKEK
jgi:hypothetical protein